MTVAQVAAWLFQGLGTLAAAVVVLAVAARLLVRAGGTTPADWGADLTEEGR